MCCSYLARYFVDGVKGVEMFIFLFTGCYAAGSGDGWACSGVGVATGCRRAVEAADDIIMTCAARTQRMDVSTVHSEPPWIATFDIWWPYVHIFQISTVQMEQ